MMIRYRGVLAAAGLALASLWVLSTLFLWSYDAPGAHASRLYWDNATAVALDNVIMGDEDTGLFWFVHVRVLALLDMADTLLAGERSSPERVPKGRDRKLSCISVRRPSHGEPFPLCDYGRSHRRYAASSIPPISPSPPAKDADLVLSGQLLSEWTEYASLIEQANSTGSLAPFLDLRGNHDCFNVVRQSPSLLRDYYDSFSASHSRNGTAFRVPGTSDVITFISLDACPARGPSRPFNFWGVLDADAAAAAAARVAAAPPGHVILLGHYPRAILREGDFSGVLGGASAYLCGHLHTLLGLAPRMHAYHADAQSLELEVGDLKDNRRFRVVLFDHGLMSSADMDLDAPWPRIVITNPKDARYSLPGREPLHRLRASTHVRVAWFGDAPPARVSVRIDGEAWRSPPFVYRKPLIAFEWDPRGLALDETHVIQVAVTDERGASCESAQPFRLDGRREDLDGFGALLLTSPLQTTIKFAVLAADFVTVLLLLAAPLGAIARRVFPPSVATWPIFPRSFYAPIRAVLAAFVSLPFRRPLSYAALLLYGLYAPLGPWFAGQFLFSGAQPDALGAAWSLSSTDPRAVGWFYLAGIAEAGGAFHPTMDTWMHAVRFLVFLYPVVALDAALAGTGCGWAGTTVAAASAAAIINAASGVHGLAVFYGWWTFVLGPASSWWVAVCAAIWVAGRRH